MVSFLVQGFWASPVAAQVAKGAKKAKSTATAVFPPTLPGGKTSVTDQSDEFLQPPAALASDASFAKEVTIAKTSPTVDWHFYPGQAYAGKPWSNWGDSLAANGKYYASIGDHLAPQGNAFVYEYDPATQRFRKLVDVRDVLKLPDGHYTPGKIHGRLDLSDDGWLYFSTHRGSPRVTTDAYHYRGDWIIRHHLASGKSEVVAQGPVPKHCIPNSVLDPKRGIFYGGTAPGETTSEGSGVRFFAYDVRAKRVLYDGPDGPARYMIFAPSTGRLYYVPGGEAEGPLMRFDPTKEAAPEKLPVRIGLRAATQETQSGVVYSVSQGGRGSPATVYALNTKSETVEKLGSAGIGSQSYIATLDVDPTGRYLYYMPGAHGGSEQDGSPIIQFDVKTRRRKVIAFLHPFYQRKYGVTPVGTYSAAVDPQGDKLYITWNVHRAGRAWDCCALTVVHIPETERP